LEKGAQIEVDAYALDGQVFHTKHLAED
jgi:hypothetical protein